MRMRWLVRMLVTLSALAAATSLAGAQGDPGRVHFTSTDGTVRCYIGAFGPAIAACITLDPPRGTDLRSGREVRIGPRSRAGRIRAGFPLPEGGDVTRLGFRCLSLADGIACADLSTGRGFSMCTAGTWTFPGGDPSLCGPIPPGFARSVRLRSLVRAGLSLRSGRVDGRRLTLRLATRRATTVRLTVRAGTRRIASYGPVRIRAGRSGLVRVLRRRPPAGVPLSVQVLAYNADGRARGLVGLRTAPINRPPGTPALTGAGVDENAPAGTDAGRLTAVDPDADRPTFALVAGPGDTDNALFRIAGDRIVTAAPLDHEAGALRAVRVRVSDGHGHARERSFTIPVRDINETPTAPALAGAAVAENAPAGTPAGALTATDPDGDPLVFTLVAGAGDADNGAFSVDGPTLRTAASLDHEAAAARAVRVRVDDGRGGTAEAALAVAVTDVREPALVMTASGAAAYTENGAAIPVDGALTVTAPEGTTLTRATVAIVDGLQPGLDLIELAPTPGFATDFDPAAGVLTLRPLAPADTASVAEFQAALRAVAFRSDAEAPGASRTIAFRVDDGAGLGPAATRQVQITQVDDPPAVAGVPAAALEYTENDPAIGIAPALALTDPDSANLSQVTIDWSAGARADDRLAVPGAPGSLPSGITATGGTGGTPLVLQGAAPVADYQGLLRTVTYEAVGDAPATSPRTLRIVATDTGATASPPATRAVSVTAVNDAPTITTSAGALAYTEGDAPSAVDGGLTVTDPDGTTLASAVVRISDGLEPATDQLLFTDQLGIGGAYDSGTGTLTLTGTASLAAYRTALRSIAYRSTSANPAAAKAVVFTAHDGTTQGAPATRAITVTRVEAPPVAVADRYDAIGNTALFMGTSAPAGAPATTVSGSLLDNDTDLDGSPLYIEPVAGAATALGGTFTVDAAGAFTYRPARGLTGADDSFTYRVCDTSPCSAAAPRSDLGTVVLPIAGRVWYVDNRATGSGTSWDPYGQLTGAAAASDTGDTVYVLGGDGTDTGLTAAYVMTDTERLVGEAAGLTIDPDGPGPLGTVTLHPAAPDRRPHLVGPAGGDAVTMAIGTTVSGVAIDPGDAGGGIAAGFGAGGLTITDVVVANTTGASATRPGVALVTTTTPSRIDGLTVTTQGTALRLSFAGTVTLTPGSTIALTSTGSAALDVESTNLGTSQIDSVNVTGSPTGGIRMANTTGAMVIDGLSLTTTGGTALELNTTSLTVPAAGAATVQATGGPAVTITGPGNDVALDTASSTGSPTHGIRLEDTGTGTFSADAGLVQGQSGQGVTVLGGSGAVTYGGDIGDGPGNAASVNVIGRSAGIVTLSGRITDGPDNGGGIDISANTGGTTRFTGASSTIAAGTGTAIALASNTGHTVAFTGGSLGVSTTNGAGLLATGGGTLSVQGPGNTITTGTGTALSVMNPTIGADGITLRSVTSTGAPNGIVLFNTGALGSLTVTGAGGLCTAASPTCTGGSITGSVGADAAGPTPAGTGIVLNATRAPSFTNVRVNGSTNYGIRGTSLNGLTITGSLIDGTHGTALANDEGAVVIDNLAGTAGIGSTAISGGFDNNVRVANTTGTGTLTLGAGTTVGLTGATGTDSVQVHNNGAGALTLAVTGASLTGAHGDQIEFANLLTGTGTFTMQSATLTNAVADPGAGGVNVRAGASATQTSFTLTSSALRGARGDAVAITADGPGGAVEATVQNTVIGTSGIGGSGSVTGSGVAVAHRGNGTANVRIIDNTIRQYGVDGITVRVGNDIVPRSGITNLTVAGNTIAEPALGAVNDQRALALLSGGTVGDTVNVCTDVHTNTLAVGGNTWPGTPTSSVDPLAPDIDVIQVSDTPMRIAGLAPGSTLPGQVELFLSQNNPGSPQVIVDDFAAGFAAKPSPATCP